MTLPGSAPVAAGSVKMHANLRDAGARSVEMVWQDLKPRDVITAGAVRNAVQMVLAVSGSINCVKHLQAIATEAEVDIDVYQAFADYAERVPLLAAVKPTGHGHIEDFEAAGGARGVLKRLERQLDLDARSVSGETLREILATTTAVDERMIATLDKPLSTRPAIVIVRGSLLPGGGIVRLGGTGERMLAFKGKANIFHSRGWDWRIGMAAIASFPAREVIVGTLGTIFNLGSDEDEESQTLRQVVQNAEREDGSKLFNLATALSIMVFFALCAQCAATLAVMRRETNSWRWPIASFLYMTGLAYFAALVTYQVAAAMGAG
jgi:hypothetical protein